MRTVSRKIDFIPLVVILLIPLIVSRTMDFTSSGSRPLVITMGVLLALALCVHGLRFLPATERGTRKMATLAVLLLGVWIVCAGLLVADPMNQNQDLVFDLALTAIIAVAIMVCGYAKLFARGGNG